MQLTVTYGGDVVVVRAFDQPRLTIGRVPGSDIVLPYATISRRHCALYRHHDAVIVCDTCSTGGTRDGTTRQMRRELWSPTTYINFGGTVMLMLDDVQEPRAIAELCTDDVPDRVLLQLAVLDEPAARPLAERALARGALDIDEIEVETLRYQSSALAFELALRARDAAVRELAQGLVARR